MHWTHVSRTDARARALADKHYSRKTPGAAEFCAPGDNIVLIVRGGELGASALWVSHRPNPYAGLERPRFDGMDYWDNTYFRTEKVRFPKRPGKRAIPFPSHVLIWEAIQATLWLWGDLIPRDGFHSFIDASKVAPVYRNGKIEPVGSTYWMAGFMRHPKPTQERGLLRYIMTAEQLKAIEPVKPLYEYEQLRLFESAAD